MTTRNIPAKGTPLVVRFLTALLPIFVKIHLSLYRRTGGVVGGSISGNRVLLLTTIGRKTGQPRTTALAYIVDGDHLVIIGGAAGSPKHPAWWLNLQAHPAAQIQIGRHVQRVRAIETTLQEELSIFARNPKQRALYDLMQRVVTRKIPVIVLHRVF